MVEKTQTTNVRRVSWDTFAKVAKDTWFDHFQRMRSDPEYAAQVRREEEDAKR